jgi:transposase
MEDETRKRFRWVELFLRLENYSLVCRKMRYIEADRKWVRRYRERGLSGLSSFSRKPRSSPAQRVLDHHREWIRELRKRRLGSRRIQSELQRNHNFELSRTTMRQEGEWHTKNIYVLRIRQTVRIKFISGPTEPATHNLLPGSTLDHQAALYQ